MKKLIASIIVTITLAVSGITSAQETYLVSCPIRWVYVAPTLYTSATCVPTYYIPPGPYVYYCLEGWTPVMTPEGPRCIL